MKKEPTPFEYKSIFSGAQTSTKTTKNTNLKIHASSQPNNNSDKDSMKKDPMSLSVKDRMKMMKNMDIPQARRK